MKIIFQLIELLRLIEFHHPLRLHPPQSLNNQCPIDYLKANTHLQLQIDKLFEK